MLFTVIMGRHIDANDKVYYKGDTVESNSNLVDLFTNKFERNLQAEIDADKASIPAAPLEGKKAAPKTTSGMKDVSSEFPEAGPNNIRVEKNVKGYWVIDTDNENEKPSNKKALELEDVVPFIDSLLE